MDKMFMFYGIIYFFQSTNIVLNISHGNCAKGTHQEKVISWLIFSSSFGFITSDSYVGPDPWDYVKVDVSTIKTEHENDIKTPPDLRIPLKKKAQPDGNLGNGEWFFKRTLAIMLNGGQTKVNDDGSVDVSLQMRLEPDYWQTLNDYTKANKVLSEEMLRRSIAYVEDAIYKPSISHRIAMAWSDYFQLYLMEYKTYITWSTGILATLGLLFWLWNHMSHKHVIMLIAAVLYLYEVVISYKEAEKQELDKFLSAVNKCSWYFWKSTCEVPPPDPLIFMKHMNPLKIGIRMFTTILSEPVLALSATVNTMIHDITGGLWFPMDIILHSILIICINLMLVVLLIMVIFNYILNIPFNLNILGLISLGVRQRNRTLINETSKNNSKTIENTDRISGETLNRLLDVCSRALDSSQNVSKKLRSTTMNPSPKLKRSSSTGRLPSSSLETYTLPELESSLRKRNFATFMLGGGDSSSVKP